MEPPSTSDHPPPDPEPPPASDPEGAVIARVLAARPPCHQPDPPAVDAGDDAAVLADGMAWTVDTLVEGRHVDGRLSPEDVGFKAIAVSVSDLAAMGARPTTALLSLALPSPDPAWLDGFARGVGEALARWDIRLVGGDTVQTDGPRVITVTLGGPVRDRAITRTGAHPGDALWVTGTPGLAGAGWRRADPPAEALAALRRPDPPVAFALSLAADALPTAMMDLSDGLGTDVPRLAAASGVRLVVDPGRLPDHPALADDPMGHRFAGGDDYQLLFTAPAWATVSLFALARAHGVDLHCIGRATVGSGAALPDGSWPKGFAWFAPPAPEGA